MIDILLLRQVSDFLHANGAPADLAYAVDNEISNLLHIAQHELLGNRPVDVSPYEHLTASPAPAGTWAPRCVRGLE